MIVGGQTVTLDLPRLIVRHDLYTSLGSGELGRSQTGNRLMAAALMLCWTSGRSKAPHLRYRGDVLDYGGEVAEFLLEQGATWAEITTAGAAALNLVADSMVTRAAVDAAKGNSEARSGGPSDDSSGSSGGGDSRPADSTSSPPR